MPTPRPPSLGVILRQLRDGADDTGDAGPVALSHGATLRMRSARVGEPGRQARRRQLIIGRQGAPPSALECQTFLGYGQVPDSAVGVCYLPTATGWYYVAYTWETPYLEMPQEALPL